MKFKVSYSREQVKQVKKSIKNKYTGFLSDSSYMKRIGKQIRTRNIETFREGYNVDGESFPPLANKTVSRRNALASVNKKHIAYRPNRSNITLTGQLVQSLRVKFLKSGTFLYKFIGTHSGYNYIRGGKGPAIRNAKITEHLEEIDSKYKLYGVTKTKRSELITYINKQFKRYLRRGK